MEKLRQYLSSRKKSDFAKTVGISPVYLSHLLAGIKTPSLKLMIRIQDATGFEVDLNSWSPSTAPAVPASGADGSLPLGKVEKVNDPSKSGNPDLEGKAQ